MKQTGKVIPVKYFLIGGVVVFACIAALFIFLGYREASVKKRLLESGIHSTGWVLQLKESRSKKRNRFSNSNYYMEVAFFADDSDRKNAMVDTAVSKAKNGSDFVDKLFNKLHKEDKPPGNYQTISIPISKYHFQKYRIEEKVKIVYLKEDPLAVMLEEDLY